VTILPIIHTPADDVSDVFYGEENPALAGVDVMTDVSQPGTAYTRYTAAPTTASRTSTKRSSRAKRKADRNTGKKGTAEEEEYLLRSVVKLVTRFGLTCSTSSFS
jgi:elongator complex protein 1